MRNVTSTYFEAGRRTGRHTLKLRQRFLMLPSWQFFVCPPGSSLLCAGLSLVAERGATLLWRRGCSLWRPLVAEQTLRSRSSQTPERARQFGTPAQLFRGLWSPPTPGIEPVSFPLAGGLRSTGPPGTSRQSLNPDCAGLMMIFGSSKEFFQIYLKDVILNTDNLTIQRGLSQHHVWKQKLGRNLNIQRRKKRNP